MITQTNTSQIKPGDLIQICKGGVFFEGTGLFSANIDDVFLVVKVSSEEESGAPWRRRVEVLLNGQVVYTWLSIINQEIKRLTLKVIESE